MPPLFRSFDSAALTQRFDTVIQRGVRHQQSGEAVAQRAVDTECLEAVWHVDRHALFRLQSLKGSDHGTGAGQLRTGAFADVLIFDLSKVNDAATYEKPHQLSEGFDDIIVNGELARRNGMFTTALAGRVLRPERN